MILYKYFLFILILFIVYKSTYKYKKDKSFLRSIFLKRSKTIKTIVYLINPTAGLANTLRGMASTFYLSYFLNVRIFLKEWNSIVYYFDFPKELLYCKNVSIEYIFEKFNKKIFKIFKSNNVSILLTDIHGFMNVLIGKFYSSRELLLLKDIYSLNKINKIVLNNIIYKEIFIPSRNILKYLNIFNKKRKGKKVLGIHIRSGIFSNNFTEEYFSRKIQLKVFYDKAKEIIINNNISFIYIISDNANYLKEMNDYFFKMLINIPFKGDIVHSRFSLYNPFLNDNAVRIVSEFIILSNCDTIIGTKLSSFSYESCHRLMKICLII